jgi:hypothetical protein
MLTKIPSLVAIGLAASFFLLGQPNLKAAAQGPAKFDGSWEVTVDTKAYKNANGTTAQAWVKHFVATVKNGVFHGEKGVRGQPSFYEMNGTIQADGAASLHVSEITGDQKYNFSDHPKGPPGKGHPYTYEISAHFGEKQGSATIGPESSLLSDRDSAAGTRKYLTQSRKDAKERQNQEWPV